MAIYRLLSRKEVAELLGISPRTFDRWRSLWKARGLDIGEVRYRHTVRFRPDAVEKLLANPNKYKI